VNQRGGSEWEPIKFFLEGYGDSNKTNTASKTRLRLTTQVVQAHAATEVLLDLGTRGGFGPRATRAMALGVAQIPPHALFEFP
jgi:hypothetical protein